MRLCQFAPSHLDSPHRQLIYWFATTIATLAATSIVVWFSGLVGVAFALIAAIALGATWTGIFIVGLFTG